jgi:hypothetical protein
MNNYFHHNQDRESLELPSVVCIGELGLRHDYSEYEGFRVARESAVEQDKIGKVSR